jgi:hypothetical protein
MRRCSRRHRERRSRLPGAGSWLHLTGRIGQVRDEGVEIDKADADAIVEHLRRQSTVVDQGQSFSFAEPELSRGSSGTGRESRGHFGNFGHSEPLI